MKYLIAFVFGLMFVEASIAQVQRPNLIILMADQLRYESCGYAGDEKAITPNIDRLANNME